MRRRSRACHHCRVASKQESPAELVERCRVDQLLDAAEPDGGDEAKKSEESSGRLEEIPTFRIEAEKATAPGERFRGG